MPLLPPPLPAKLAFYPSQILGAAEAENRLPALVEFSDYQCPPCRMSYQKINNLVAQYSGKLNFVVRNLPLNIHRYAYSAACAAEAAREQNRFMSMHDALYDSDTLTDKDISTVARRIGLQIDIFEKAWHGSAKKRVDADLKDARTFGIDSTPSFLFCTRTGEVYRLHNPDQIKELMK